MNRATITIIAVVVIVAAAVGGFYSYAYFLTTSTKANTNPCQNLSSSSAPGLANASSTGSTVHFTMIESDSGPYEGINGSAHHSPTVNWPVMVVHKGQNVVIEVYNCASSEPHGFAISHYFDKSLVSVHPGQSITVSFVADQTGNYLVYCDVFCAIHPLMQNGLLVVTP